MPGRLIGKSGSVNGVVFNLGPAHTSLGRGDDNDIVLDSAHASRHHAEIHWDGGHYVIYDLGSKNGTSVNGQRLNERQALAQGDELTLAGVTFSFDLESDTLTLQADPPPEQPGPIRVDTVTAEVWVRGERVSLSAKEYLALAHLARSAGALVSKEALAQSVWPEYEGQVSDYNVEQLVSRLRRKIEAEPERPQHLITVRGLGYRLVV